MFDAYKPVRDYLFSKGVDRDIVQMDDHKFFKSILYILVNLFGYKTKISQDQFFKYGFAEMKMLLCCDVIAHVRNKQKQLKMQRSLSAQRYASRH